MKYKAHQTDLEVKLEHFAGPSICWGGVQSLAIFWRGLTFRWEAVTPNRDSRGNIKEYEGT